MKHGTYAGYNQHTRTGTPTCAPCRKAATDYQREWRKRNPDKYERGVEWGNARDRALTRLSHRYPNVYRTFLDEELSKSCRG